MNRQRRHGTCLLLATLAPLTLVNIAGCARGEEPRTDSGRTDASAGDATISCRSNADCTNPMARVCDPVSRRCVQCTPAMDSCPSNQVCDPTSMTCVMGCRTSADCAMGARDGGTADGGVPGRIHCLTSARRCVQCLTDDHCPIGMLCTDNACVPGCNTTRPCPSGLTCCSGMCVDTRTDARACGGCGFSCTAAQPTCCDGRCTNTQIDPANCGTCGRTCMPAHATGRCTMGACAIASCDTGWWDVDGMASNGCECGGDSVSTNCLAATNVGLLAPGMMRELRGVLRMPGLEHWYRIGLGSGGTPRVQFATNPGSAIKFDVQTDCGVMPLGCPDRMEGAMGLTTWEMVDNPGPNRTRMTPRPSTIVLRVYATASVPGCEQYALTVSN